MFSRVNNPANWLSSPAFPRSVSTNPQRKARAWISPRSNPGKSRWRIKMWFWLTVTARLERKSAIHQRKRPRCVRFLLARPIRFSASVGSKSVTLERIGRLSLSISIGTDDAICFGLYASKNWSVVLPPWDLNMYDPGPAFVFNSNLLPGHRQGNQDIWAD